MPPLPGGFVPINLHILRGASRGDNIGSPVAVEIRELQILAGHFVLIHDALAPLLTRRIQRGEYFDSHRPELLCVTAPTDHNLVRTRSEEITTGESMPID